MNGDGQLDLITGHYWPGDIFVFWGKKDGTFQAMENLKDTTGRNLNAGPKWESEEEPAMSSLAAAPYAADFDGDGDYDMLIGNIVGNIVYMENVGDKKNPKFSTKRRDLMAGGRTIEVAGGDSGPVFEDWDGDGIRDLLTGAGDGSVSFFKNIGTAAAPKFAAGIHLIKPGPDSGHRQVPVGEDPTGPGGRTKIHVVDYNHDGTMDLLVGDFVSIEKPAPKLTPEQVTLRDSLREKVAAFEKKMMGFDEKMTAEDEAKMEALFEEFQGVFEQLAALEPGSNPHGFVWLYLRKSLSARL